MTAAPIGLSHYRKRQHATSRLEVPAASHANPAVQRLQAKLQNGSISATERKILQVLQSQTTTQAQAARKAKAVIDRAAQAAASEPLSSAEIQARFKCRAHAAEIAAAQARTAYIPEGPQADDEDDRPNAATTASTSFKRQRKDGSGASRSSREYWDCYFRQTKKKAPKRPVVAEPRGASEEEDECEESAWSFDDSDSDRGYLYSDADGSDCDSDEEFEADHAKNFYKQPSLQLAPVTAFQQLVQLVQGFPVKVREHKAAAHLKSFASRKVTSKLHLESAARQVWLAVHPDKNNSPAAKEASQSLSNLLDKFKSKGVL